MPANRIPHPDDADGTGPCSNPCHHWDCKEAHDRSEMACNVCGKPMGFGVEYTGDGEDTICHVRCPK